MGADTLKLGFYQHHLGALYKVTGTRIDKTSKGRIRVDYEDDIGRKYSRDLEDFTSQVAIVGNSGHTDKFKYVGEKPKAIRIDKRKKLPKGKRLNS